MNTVRRGHEVKWGPVSGGSAGEVLLLHLSAGSWACLGKTKASLGNHFIQNVKRASVATYQKFDCHETTETSTAF